jgi:hypothetical protein
MTDDTPQRKPSNSRSRRSSRSIEQRLNKVAAIIIAITAVVTAIGGLDQAIAKIFGRDSLLYSTTGIGVKRVPADPGAPEITVVMEGDAESPPAPNHPCAHYFTRANVKIHVKGGISPNVSLRVTYGYPTEPVKLPSNGTNVKLSRIDLIARDQNPPSQLWADVKDATGRTDSALIVEHEMQAGCMTAEFNYTPLSVELIQQP